MLQGMVVMMEWVRKKVRIILLNYNIVVELHYEQEDVIMEGKRLYKKIYLPSDYSEGEYGNVSRTIYTIVS